MDAVHPKYLEARAAALTETHADALSMEAASARHLAVTASIASGELLLPLQRADPRDVQFWRDFGAPREVVAAARGPTPRYRVPLKPRKTGRPPDPFTVLLRGQGMDLDLARRDMRHFVLLEHGVRAALDEASLDPGRFVNYAADLVSLDWKKELVDLVAVRSALREFLE